jgi:hypothetical protein
VGGEAEATFETLRELTAFDGDLLEVCMCMCMRMCKCACARSDVLTGLAVRVGRRRTAGPGCTRPCSRAPGSSRGGACSCLRACRHA